jgi:GT2 family glycosyltransferase
VTSTDRRSSGGDAPLTWSLVVATINREECLLRSLAANARQSRPPRQIIVIDASTGWSGTRDRVLAELAPQFPQIEWIYEHSPHASLPRQRNQGLGLCRADVAFMLDDDSFMYADCASEIMRVYEAEGGEAIGGVCARLMRGHEGTAAAAEENAPAAASPPSLAGRLKNRMQLLWYSESLFLPYDGAYHDGQAVDEEIGVPVRLFHGCRMTFRTAFARELGGFQEMLLRVAFGEDADFSYRMSQRHPLVLAPKARLFHEQSPVGRSKRRLNTTLVLLNTIALYKLNAHDASAARPIAYRFLFKRALLELVRDCGKLRFELPHLRGALAALRLAPQVLASSGEQLVRDYPALQQQLFDRA